MKRDHNQWIQEVGARYERPLCQYAYRMTGNFETARDAVQDTFLKLWREKNMADERAAPWLFRVCRNRCQPRTNRISHRNVRNQPFTKKRTSAPVCTINKLVNRNETARRQFFAQRPDGRNGKDISHAAALQHVNVRPCIYGFRRYPVPLAVAWQKDEPDMADPPDRNRR